MVTVSNSTKTKLTPENFISSVTQHFQEAKGTAGLAERVDYYARCIATYETAFIQGLQKAEKQWSPHKVEAERLFANAKRENERFKQELRSKRIRVLAGATAVLGSIYFAVQGNWAALSMASAIGAVYFAKKGCNRSKKERTMEPSLPVSHPVPKPQPPSSNVAAKTPRIEPISNPVFRPMPAISGYAPLPVGAPPRIEHGPNTCFLSAMLWALFLNEPYIQQELDCAISRRIDDLGLSRNAVRADIYSALLEADLRRKAPNEAEKIKVLLSLLELSTVIEFCKTVPNGSSIPGEQINLLRKSLHRLNPGTFQGKEDQRDSMEAIATFLPFILEHTGNALEVQRTYQLQGAPEPHPEAHIDRKTRKGPKKRISYPSHFMLYPKTGSTVKKLMADYCFDDSFPTHSIRIANSKNSDQTYDYPVLMRATKLQSPPPVLVFNLRKPDVNPIPLSVEETLVLDDRFFANGEKASYELTGIVHRTGSMENGHFTASVKTGGNIAGLPAYYSCDDMSSQKVSPITKSDYLNKANTGYVLVYRRIPS